MYNKEHLDKIRKLSIKACNTAKAKREEEYYKNPKLCLNCGKPIPYHEHKRKKFCSRPCSVSYNNVLRSNEPKNERKCIRCGQVMKKKKSESWADYNNRKYCCLKCYVDSNYEKYISDWKNGLVDGALPSGGLNDYIRRYIFEKYEYKCAECGWSKINKHTNSLPLEVHHIDGNSDNNKENNLILLCPCCHSLTRNYKGANIKATNRSIYRQKYYKS